MHQQLALHRRPRCSADLHLQRQHTHTASKTCQLRGLSRRPCPLVQTAAAEPASTADASQQDSWSSFAARVSGEWEGVTATFSPEGVAQTLPENFVPEAFREWGVELFDWQSQCSSLATADPAGANSTSSKQLRSVVRRLMPTVGCEADAIAFTEDDSSSSSSSTSSSSNDSSSGQALVFAADGSYSTGPEVLPAISKDDGPSKFQVEHCLMLPHEAHGPDSSSSSSNSGSTMRVKVVQQFRRDWSSGAWKLAEVDLHKERFDGPYTGKRELAGCGGGQPGISQLPALTAQDLAGSWAARTAAAADGSGGGVVMEHQEPRLSCLDAAGAAPEGTQLTLLPLNAWSAVQLTPQGQLHKAEAGVLLCKSTEGTELPSSRLVSIRVYNASTGKIHGASIGQESST